MRTCLDEMLAREEEGSELWTHPRIGSYYLVVVEDSCWQETEEPGLRHAWGMDRRAQGPRPLEWQQRGNSLGRHY